MYLGLLNDEQKKICINLIINVAKADENFSESEKILIDSYCNEMGIIFDYTSKVKDIDEVIEELNSTLSFGEKKIIVFEIIGLAMVDNDFMDKERDLIDKIAIRFGISKDYTSRCESLLNEYFDLQKRVNELVVE